MNFDQMLKTKSKEELWQRYCSFLDMSLDEFMEYAKTIETYEPYLDSEIQSRYEDWKNNDWRNSSDRPITNWKSSLKRRSLKK